LGWQIARVQQFDETELDVSGSWVTMTDHFATCDFMKRSGKHPDQLAGQRPAAAT
jgi:hypothetical protein